MQNVKLDTFWFKSNHVQLLKLKFHPVTDKTIEKFISSQNLLQSYLPRIKIILNSDVSSFL